MESNFSKDGISVPFGYVLMKVTAYDPVGGRPDTTPVLYAETGEELEKYCDDNGYDYTSGWKEYIIESMEDINTRRKREDEEKWKHEHPSIKSIDLIGISYVEMLRIFSEEDPKLLEAYIYFRHILRNKEYNNFRFSRVGDREDTVTLMEVIRKQQMLLTITISPEDYLSVFEECIHMSYIQYAGVNVVKEGLYHIFEDYIRMLKDPWTGIKTYNGLINKAIPMKMNMDENELFKFKLTDTEGNEYYFDGKVRDLSNDMAGDMEVGFLIQEVPTNRMEIIV